MLGKVYVMPAVSLDTPCVANGFAGHSRQPAFIPFAPSVRRSFLAKANVSRGANGVREISCSAKK